MAAVNLFINERVISYEIRNNVIIFKKNNIIIYEFPIPKNYYLARTIEIKENKIFIITKNKLNNPSFVPEGFQKSQISLRGNWCIEELPKDDKKKTREYEYIDTSSLTIDDVANAFYGNKRAEYLLGNNFKIPKGFWVSIRDYRDFQFLEKIRDISPFMKTYYEQARLIREDELMSIIALDSLIIPTGAEENFYTIHGELNSYEGIAISCPSLIVDNWRILVSSVENSNVYRIIDPIGIDFKKPLLLDYSVCVSASEGYPFLIYPVIDEEKNAKKALKYYK